MKLVLSLLLFTFFSINISSQTDNENWVPVTALNNQHIYIDVYGLESFKGDDIYIWAMQSFNKPLEMEGIKRDIYKTRTYYLINKRLKEYSILEIVFYDEDGNVITSYSYHHDTKIQRYRYNYPIFPGSDMDAILKKSLEYISPLNKGNPYVN